MGQITESSPVQLILAVTSRHEQAIAWSRSLASQAWGPLAAVSPEFDFTETDYYRATMGTGLKKVFLAFERLVDPAELAAWKLATNAWEAEYASLGGHEEPRPLNLDPGYLTPAKLVLASTKDHSHRMYLRNGIYAEVTLYYKNRCWQPREWTYPDYRRSDFQQFFSQLRDRLLQRQKERPQS